MKMLSLEDLINDEHYFASETYLSKFVVEEDTDIKEKMPQFPTPKYIGSIGDLWYEYQRVLISTVGSKYFDLVRSTLRSYYANDTQYPPDIVKSTRLASLLNALNPDNILEIGCGTSSAIIRKYCNDKKVSGLTVDNNEDWIESTKSKIGAIENKGISDGSHNFICLNNSLDLEKISKFISHSKNLFIFLDAQVEKDDQLQGLGTILKIADSLPSKWNMLIDSRTSAVYSLNYLSNRINAPLYLISNIFGTRLNVIPNEDRKVALAKSKRLISASAFSVNTFFTLCGPKTA